MNGLTIAEEYLAWMRRATLADAHALMHAGVPIEAIALVCPVRARIVRVADQFESDSHGRPAWIVPVAVTDPENPNLIECRDPEAVISGPNVVDIVAFSLLAPDKFAVRTGRAAVLGAIPPQYAKPAPVWVHRGVVSWLRLCCRGIVPLSRDPHVLSGIIGQINRVITPDVER